MQCGCELGPRAPGPESSPPWPPCPALQKGGSLCPQQERLALQETARRSGEGRREGTQRLDQVQGRVQASGLIFSGARYLPYGSDSVGSDTIHFPSRCCLCSLAGAVPFAWFTLPFLSPPRCQQAHPPLPPSGPCSTHSQPPVKHTFTPSRNLQANVVIGSLHDDRTGIPSSLGLRWIPQPTLS